jgi:iron complex transport system ATP-binding protein
MALMLEARGLSYGYGDVAVGSEVSFSVARGAVLCLIGRNGAGKSALLRTLLGIVAPLAGAVIIDGRDRAAMSREAAARALAYAPQAHESYFPFSALDIVLMGRAARVRPFAQPGRDDRRIALDALRRLGVDHLAAKPYTQISGGERQLVLIARALAQEAAYLVMDEPAASLDIANQTRVLAVIRALADDGLCVIFATHDPDHAFLCADQVAMLGGGRLVAHGAPDAVMTGPALSALYATPIETPFVEALGRRICAPVCPC